MRYTLLELTQLILSSLDGDEVDAIGDTVESVQVTTLIKNVFYDLATELNLPEHETLFELTASGDNTKPALMTIPVNVTALDVVRYDISATADTHVNWREVKFLNFPDFLDMSNGLREETTNVASMNVVMNGETHEFLHRSNTQPEFYTTHDDFTLIFNSYDTVEDTTLQASKTMCSGSVYPVFTIADAFAPDLDPTQFAYFIQKIKVRAHFELKQLVHPEAANEARRQQIALQSQKRRTAKLTGLDQTVRYGKTGSPSRGVNPLDRAHHRR